MPAAQKRRPARAGKRPGRVSPPQSRPETGTAAQKGDAGEQAVKRRAVCTPGRPRVYETPEDLLEAVEAYFDRISRTVDVTETVDTGEKDSDGHRVFAQRVVCNDDGEVIRVTEFLVPPSITDLCLELGITKQTWVNYRNRTGYLQIVEWAKTRVESYLRRESLTRTKGLQGVIFNLEQNFKSEEKNEPRPIENLDLSAMTDEELIALANE